MYKFIGFEKLEDGIYNDVNNENINYVNIKKVTNWEGFKNQILSLRNNSRLPVFNAAICSMLTYEGEQQFVQIYKEQGYKTSDLIRLKEKINSDLLFAH